MPVTLSQMKFTSTKTKGYDTVVETFLEIKAVKGKKYYLKIPEQISFIVWESIETVTEINECSYAVICLFKLNTFYLFNIKLRYIIPDS